MATSGDLIWPPAGTFSWPRTNLRRLDARLLDIKEKNLDSFLSSYLKQLADAPTEVVQLGAEVLYVQLWIVAKALTGIRKRAAIEQVLALDSQTVRPRGEIASALDMGLVRTGAWHHQLRWRHLHDIVEIAERVRSLPHEERAATLNDPWRWFDVVFPEGERAAAQRHALLHLVHPDTFEAILSLDHKKQILQRFKDRLVARSGQIDHDLFELRKVMAEEFGPRFDYYRRPVIDLWR